MLVLASVPARRAAKQRNRRRADRQAGQPRPIRWRRGGAGWPAPRRPHQRMARRAISQATFQDAAKKMAAAGAAALLTMSPLSGAAIASEFDILAEPQPTSAFIVDDAGVLSKSTRNEVTKKLKGLEASGDRRQQIPIRPCRHRSLPAGSPGAGRGRGPAHRSRAPLCAGAQRRPAANPVISAHADRDRLPAGGGDRAQAGV
jgi:hypothetical protein